MQAQRSQPAALMGVDQKRMSAVYGGPARRQSRGGGGKENALPFLRSGPVRALPPSKKGSKPITRMHGLPTWNVVVKE